MYSIYVIIISFSAVNVWNKASVILFPFLSFLYRSGGFNIAVNDTVSPRSSQSKSNKMSHQLKKQSSPATPSTEEWELLTRPQPDPSPGPIIVEIPLVRGTSSGFGFSIAGGVGSEFLEGDSGIFITQVIFTVYVLNCKSFQCFLFR